MALLNCTAIVNTSNESLNDKNPVSDGIHQLAGPELRDELLKLKGTVGGATAQFKLKDAKASKLENEFRSNADFNSFHQHVWEDGG